MLRVAAARYYQGKLSVCLSIRLSVTLRYRDHRAYRLDFCENNLNLTISLSAEPNMTDLLQTEHPPPPILAGIGVGYRENCRFSTFKPPYLGNGARYYVYALSIGTKINDLGWPLSEIQGHWFLKCYETCVEHLGKQLLFLNTLTRLTCWVCWGNWIYRFVIFFWMQTFLLISWLAREANVYDTTIYMLTSSDAYYTGSVLQATTAVHLCEGNQSVVGTGACVSRGNCHRVCNCYSAHLAKRIATYHTKCHTDCTDCSACRVVNRN